MKTTNHPRSAVRVALPDWVKPATGAQDVQSFFTAIALAELEGGWFRLTVGDQRALLGCAPFGNCALRSDGSSITVSRSVCFGTDGESWTIPAHELTAMIAKGVTCRPGVYAPLRK